MNKKAITTLLFGNKKYIIGAIISAYLHKQFIKKYNLKIDITIMLHRNLIEYIDDLSVYYDKIIIIDLDETKISPKSLLSLKLRHASVMKYLTNKAQMFNLTEYDKVLFIDIDFLPIKKEFYNIFDLDTPAFYSVEVPCDNFNQIYNNNSFIDIKANQKYIDNKEYNKIIKNMKGSINATLMLVKPSVNDYKNFLLFTKSVESVDGIESNFGIDEILILGFVIFIKKTNVHCIPSYFSDKEQNLNNHSLGLNFDSGIKPWLKLPMFQWAKENIWHIVAKKALKQTNKFTNLYTAFLIDNLINFYENYMSNRSITGFNISILKTKGKAQFFSLLKYVKKHKSLDIEKDYSIVKYIMNEAQRIHSFISKNPDSNYSEIMKLIDNK